MRFGRVVGWWIEHRRLVLVFKHALRDCKIKASFLHHDTFGKVPLSLYLSVARQLAFDLSYTHKHVFLAVLE